MVQDVDGSIYGTTGGGGTNGNNGTIFRFSAGSSPVTLVSFSGTNGAYLGTSPSQLFKASDGNFYGTTASGGVPDGTNSYGTIFRWSPNGTFTTLISFTGTNLPYLGANPSRLIQGTDGNLYGTTHAGGSTNRFNYFGAGYNFGDGTVFRISTNGNFNTLFLFTGTNGAYPGRAPLGGLFQDADGSLYGTTEAGGTNDDGTVFKITTNGASVWSFSFANTNGADPQAALTQGADGNLYGVTTTYSLTKLGSPAGSTIFKITTNGALTTLAHLVGSSTVPNPVAALTLASDGNFYGTTLQGGTGIGTVFKMTPSGVVSTLYTFIGGGTSGMFPFAGLLQGSDNVFYGVASGGGAYTNGIIYQLSVALPPQFVCPVLGGSGGTLYLSWSAVSGRTYQLEYATDLTSANWTNLGGVTVATNGVINATDYQPPDQQRFYRAVESP